MKIFKEISKLWNNNFDKGVSVYQICLMVTMIIAVFQSNSFLLMFSMFNCLVGYLEPNQSRYSIDWRLR